MLISQDSYKNGIHLSGLLFFHRISDNPIGGSAVKYRKMFQNLCGNEALKNVILVTTMWDEVGEEEGRYCETELFTKSEYWKTMLDLGCRTSRFYNNTESARDIISQFQDARCTVLLQREMVDLRLELVETSVGRILFYWQVEFIKKNKGLLARLDATLKQNQHSEIRTVIKKSKEAMQAILWDADVRRRQYSDSSSISTRRSISNYRKSYLHRSVGENYNQDPTVAQPMFSPMSAFAQNPYIPIQALIKIRLMLFSLHLVVIRLLTYHGVQM